MSKMLKLPLIKANDLLRFLEKLGFKPVRMKGSHVRLKADDAELNDLITEIKKYQEGF